LCESLVVGHHQYINVGFAWQVIYTTVSSYLAYLDKMCWYGAEVMDSGVALVLGVCFVGREMGAEYDCECCCISVGGHQGPFEGGSSLGICLSLPHDKQASMPRKAKVPLVA
jgi:hypothetical protein